MFNVRIVDDAVEIDGYVNAIERLSRPMHGREGLFRERICKDAFRNALERNSNVRILLNHNRNFDLGGTADGNLTLAEDAIGLRACATIRNPEVVEKARSGDLRGWSFGFYDRDVKRKIDDGMIIRDVVDMDLEEVSLLDRTKIPAYEGTLVNVRESDGQSIKFGEGITFDNTEENERAEAAPAETTKPEAGNDAVASPENAASGENNDNPSVNTEIDYSHWERTLNELKGDN